MTDTLDKLLTNTEISDALRNLLKVNGWKEDTQKAKTVEYAFLRGLMTANPQYEASAFLNLCMLSGRSILTVTPPRPH